MKYKIIVVSITLLVVATLLFIGLANSWRNYRQEYPPVAFKYPKSFGQPEIFFDKTKGEWDVSFRHSDSGFFINNGFQHIWSEGATLEKYLAHYQADVDAKNEVKDYKIEYIRVGDFPAVKVKWHGYNYAVTDVFIYQESMQTSNVIMVQAGEDFVDDKTLEKIVQSLKLTTNSFLQHQLLVVPDGMQSSLAATEAMAGRLLTSTATDPIYSAPELSPQAKKELQILEHYMEEAKKLTNQELTDQCRKDGEALLVHYEDDLAFKYNAYEREAYRRDLIDPRFEDIHDKLLAKYGPCYGILKGQCRE